MLKTKNKILFITLCVIVAVLIAALIAIYVVPGAIVMFSFIPSLEYSIKSSQGRYPSALELGDAIWTYNDSEIKIELITINGNILGEISTAEASYDVQGKTLYAEMYLYCSHSEEPQKNNFEHSQHTIFSANYEYVDGKIFFSNLKTDLNHFDFSKDFTLERKKNIEKESSETWKCAELDIQLLSYSEINEYYQVKFWEKNKEYDLIKIYDNYYELTFSPYGYIVYFSMKNEDGKISLEIVGKCIDEKRTFETYIPDEIKTLTFSKHMSRQ